ncbi:BppU family phage baseplate upper protein [Bacillus paranthracis]|uniref:BppU family phage baseplate upper protein n=1 Tax=Bacillus paranthracis TaxID=2026186 RepID=UPI003014F51F
MNNQSYEITVDTRKSISHSNIEFAQNNLNISELIFNITEDEKAFPLNDTDKIIVYFEKPDKTVVFQDKEVELLDKAKGKIKVLLTSQTLVKAGDVKGQISIERIEDGTKKRVNTYYFSFKVRSSIASNESIESTNEFQIFDKIMVAGEKFKDFEDKDFDELIAAGELAKGALPKTGGTLKGTVVMENGDFEFKNPMSDVLFRNNQSGIFVFYDKAQDQVIWTYNSKTKEFIVGSTTNLLRKTGDTMTGSLGFQVSSGGKAIRGTNGDNVRSGFMFEDWGIVGQDWENNRKFFEYLKGSDTFNVTSKNTNLVTKTKDGRATLTLTENATQYGSTYTPVATRRGNAVTLRMVISRNGNDNGVITTLPADMRPVDGVTSTIVASDGTSSDVVIRLNGEVEILTKNKTYRILLTYVVD